MKMRDRAPEGKGTPRLQAPGNERYPSPRRPSILIIGPVPPPPGGVETATAGILTSHLASAYRFVHLDTSQRRGTAARGFTWQNMRAAFRRYAQLLWLVLRYRPAVVYLPVSATPAGFARDGGFILLSWLLRRRIVGHVNASRFNSFFSEARAPLRQVLRWLLQRLDVLIATSAYWQTAIGRFVRTVPVEVVPNGVDVHEFRPYDGEDAVRDAAPTPPGSGVRTDTAHPAEDPRWQGRRGRVMFLGSLGQRKGIYDLLRATALLRSQVDVFLVCAGREDAQGDQARIARLSGELGLNNAVSFVGNVYGEDKVRLLRGADVFVLPSYAENQPIALLETMATGLPVVTTPVGAVPEVIEDGANGFLVAPGDDRALADRLLTLLRDPDLRSRMGVAARRTVEDRYALSIMLDRLDAIFGGLVRS